MKKSFSAIILLVSFIFLTKYGNSTTLTALDGGYGDLVFGKKEAPMKLNINSSYSNDDVFSPDKKRKKKKAFGEGATVISLGYGFPNIYKWAFSTYELLYPLGKAAGVGPFHAKFEYGLADKFGVGVHLDFATASFTWEEEGWINDTIMYESGFKGNGLTISLRGNWHFYTNKNLDLYSGIHFGYDFGAMKFFTDDPDLQSFYPDLSFPFVLGGTIGMRYYFNKNLAMYMELGYSKSLAQLGMSYKI